MDSALREKSMEAINAVIEFANMQIKTTRQVEEHFKALTLAKHSNTFKVIPKAEVKAFRHDQEELRRWLKSIASHGDVSPSDEECIQTRLKTIGVHGHFSLDQGHRVQPELQFDFNGVQACYSFATALLLDQRYRDKFGICDRKKCRKFYLGKRSGQKYCCEKCSNAERQKRYRTK